jgi:hypothetical protein
MVKLFFVFSIISGHMAVQSEQYSQINFFEEVLVMRLIEPDCHSLYQTG